MTKYLLRWTDHGIMKERGPFDTSSEAILASLDFDVMLNWQVIPVEVPDEIF